MVDLDCHISFNDRKWGLAYKGIRMLPYYHPVDCTGQVLHVSSQDNVNVNAKPKRCKNMEYVVRTCVISFANAPVW